MAGSGLAPRDCPGAMVRQDGLQDAVSQVFKIFKKTPSAAGLKPEGRDVAKDMLEVGNIPLPGFPDVNLTAAGSTGRKTNWTARATDHTTGALWTDAQQAGPAGESAAPHPGRAHEKHCYADS